MANYKNSQSNLATRKRNVMRWLSCLLVFVFGGWELAALHNREQGVDQQDQVDVSQFPVVDLRVPNRDRSK